MDQGNVPDPPDWRTKVEAFAAAGSEALCVVSDWDRTLTLPFSSGHHDRSTYSLIADGEYLGPDFRQESRALFDAFRGIEESPEIDPAEKTARMQEWWRKQFDLLLTFGFCRATVSTIVRRDELRLREGAEPFLRVLASKNVPLLILSGGIQDLIEGHLAYRDLLTPNVAVVANGFVYNKDGDAVAYSRPLIHSLNKGEVLARTRPSDLLAAGRKNILLLGDTLEDRGVLGSTGDDHILSCGFLSRNTVQGLRTGESGYDAVLPHDASMEFVNRLVGEICSR